MCAPSGVAWALVVVYLFHWIGMASAQPAGAVVPSIADLAVGEWLAEQGRLVLDHDGRFVASHGRGLGLVVDGTGTFRFSSGPLHLGLVYAGGQVERIRVLRVSADELRMRGDHVAVTYRRPPAGQAAFAARWGRLCANGDARLAVLQSPAALAAASGLPVPSATDLLVAEPWTGNNDGQMAFTRSGEYALTFPSRTFRGTFRVPSGDRLDLAENGANPNTYKIVTVSLVYMLLERANGTRLPFTRFDARPRLESRWTKVVYDEGQLVQLRDPAPDPVTQREATELGRELGRSAVEGFRKGLTGER